MNAISAYWRRLSAWVDSTLDAPTYPLTHEEEGDDLYGKHGAPYTLSREEFDLLCGDDLGGDSGGLPEAAIKDGSPCNLVSPRDKRSDRVAPRVSGMRHVH